MPRYSFVVPAYNSAPYLSRCIRSISSQGVSDWEALIVVDGSPDDSLAVAKSLARDDARVMVVNKERNEGIHRARKTGVDAAAGEYLFFLDADDELHEGCLAAIDEVLASDSQADILHLGINVIDDGVGEAERTSFEAFINRDVEVLEGASICSAAYSRSEGYRQDWRLTQRMYRTDLLKRSFSLMTDDRLGRNEDGYEYFVTSCLASRQLTRNDIVALDYHYGRGLNGGDAMSANRFVATTREFSSCLGAIEAFAAAQEGRDLSEELAGSREKAVELLFNDWAVRVPMSEKCEAALGAVEALGREHVAAEVFRILRDRAYALLAAGSPSLPGDEVREIAEVAASVDAGLDGVGGKRYQGLRERALTHLFELHVPVTAFFSHIKLFVTTHKDVALPPAARLYAPVQVGPKGTRFPWAAQDDSGDNIARLNPMYCELTTQYWAWKNTRADYYGFCHYRRYFDFNEEPHAENPYGEIMDGFINAQTAWEYRLGDDDARKVIEGYDVITTSVKDLRGMPGDFGTPREHYDDAPHLHVEDLDRMLRILREERPDYAQDADAFMSGHVSCFCNMFVMRAELFDRYCSWLFPLLDRFMDGWDTALLDKEALRTPGHLAERLLNIFLIHERRTNPDLRWRELQCVHFEHPESFDVRLSATEVPTGMRGVIPVALAADNTYVPMLTTTLRSMLDNASRDYLYDIVVLEKDISPSNQSLMREFLSSCANVRLRFANVLGLVSSFDLATSNEHISVETYYRFLIQQVMPEYDKVLYLDSDLIVCGDVSELFSTELGDNLLAAVRDIDFQGNLGMKDGKRMVYAHDVLGLREPFDYFQAGVLLLNTAALRELHSVGEWLRIASEPKFIYDDQDILNAECQGRVVFLDGSWNVMTDCAGRVQRVFSFAPADCFDAYRAAYASPMIMHYAGFEKPWKPGGCDRDELYWSYARRTPFYEKLLELRCGGMGPTAAARAVHEKAIAPGNPLRRVFDPVMPLGSRRREVAKAMVRAVRGRS